MGLLEQMSETETERGNFFSHWGEPSQSKILAKPTAKLLT